MRRVNKSKPKVRAKRSTRPRASAPLALVRAIRARTRSAGFQKYTRDLLVELCGIDTTPNAEVARMRTAEDACFRILERELGPQAFPGAQLRRKPINPAIAGHPHYSLLHFTKTPQRPEGLIPEATYAERSNLVFKIPARTPGRVGQSVALNAHVDVVAPYFPPRVSAGIVYGRGACDDKGPVVSIVAALRVLAEAMRETGVDWNQNVLAMFVVEEETGGNGSLSLALDRELKRDYDSMLVSECTGLQVHPANRGAVWYRAELTAPARVSPLELFAFVNEELEKEGAAIRAESRHPLFPQRPVQTCHGILGPFGEHPSRICSEASFDVRFRVARGADRAAALLMEDCLEAGLAGYVGLYGDKTKVLEPGTGKPMVARHYDVKRTRDGFQVRVHGAAGHMGAIRERDGAITKMAHLVRSLVASQARLEGLAAGPVLLTLSGLKPGGRLVLEGGQGFVPTHAIREIMERLRTAAHRGAETCLRRHGLAIRGEAVVKVTYEKLHNAAFDGDPDSPAMRHAFAAAEACGLNPVRPAVGWTVSCDARLFATEYPGMPVLTFGPGLLVHAHSDREQVRLDDIRQAAEFLALFLLRQTGTLP